jgi:hypothetical protein
MEVLLHIPYSVVVVGVVGSGGIGFACFLFLPSYSCGFARACLLLFHRLFCLCSAVRSSGINKPTTWSPWSATARRRKARTPACTTGRSRTPGEVLCDGVGGRLSGRMGG